MNQQPLNQDKPDSTSVHRPDPLSLRIVKQEVNFELELPQENEESDFECGNKSG